MKLEWFNDDFSLFFLWLISIIKFDYIELDVWNPYHGFIWINYKSKHLAHAHVRPPNLFKSIEMMIKIYQIHCVVSFTFRMAKNSNWNICWTSFFDTKHISSVLTNLHKWIALKTRQRNKSVEILYFLNFVPNHIVDIDCCCQLPHKMTWF